jgi:hypothetical protein
MNVICVGGTAKLLQRELVQFFGENAFIPENPEYANVCGFLKRMCAGAGIDITTAREEKKSTNPRLKSRACGSGSSEPLKQASGVGMVE